jgi:hypothetical protein
MDIEPEFRKRVPFRLFKRVALTPAQVRDPALDLARTTAKETDSRTKEFIKKYGMDVQVEVDALSPDHLADLFLVAAEPYHKPELLAAVIAEEAERRRVIRRYLTAAASVLKADHDDDE